MQAVSTLARKARCAVLVIGQVLALTRMIEFAKRASWHVER